ncbi:putative Phytocyanin domain, cupredoxin [Helianthus annuus]|nr:putative Phytocyanin domain, cupredoxin [Helianthus annuus]KAJ0541719.1 putative Phytocyanin domain, cupredoxin [Helianthus annuus]KAJ0706793.1 putative Phytocyanin domain, cupredoxin [Helianthus annuus]KAJ0710828.1 putative Phytocyanin domain, cupredoxin [Helianthus annuus]
MRIYPIGFVLLVLVTCGISCLAIDYTVGDSAGWSLSVDYSTWASGKKFNVRDSLGNIKMFLFLFFLSHNVQ